MSASDTSDRRPQPRTLTTSGERRTGYAVRCERVVHLYRTAEQHDVMALQGVNLDIAAGERIALLGPSGSGKSTLLSLLGGILRPTAGRIVLGEHDVSKLSDRELTRLRAGRVSTMLQGATRNLLPFATAYQNVTFAQLGVKRQDRVRCPDPAMLLERLRLSDVGGHSVAALSGGQRQRLALACAVAMGPDLLLADEPTSQLGVTDRDQLLRLLHEIAGERNMTTVVVTHDPEVAATFPRSVTIKNGRVGAEARDGAEYVVVGDDGLLHLPGHLADGWPAGTLVRIEPEHEDLLNVTRTAPPGADE